MNNNVNLRVVYEEYVRYGMPTMGIGRITAPTLVEALIKLVGRVRTYMDEDYIEELREEYGDEELPQAIIQRIAEQNGDGCDFIFSLKDVNTGKEYIAEEFNGCFTEWEI